MADDGFSEVGGGGSVSWAVKVRSGNVVQTRRLGNSWGYTAQDTDDLVDEPEAADDEKLYNQYFKVAIKTPTDGRPILWGRENGRVVICVPIEDDRRQIQVRWAYRKSQLPRGRKNLPDPPRGVTRRRKRARKRASTGARKR